MAKVGTLIPKQSVVTVGASDTKILEQVPFGMFRIDYFCKNTSSGGQTMTFADGQPAVAGSGRVYKPDGGIEESYDGYNVPSQNQINAICDAAGGTCAYYEKLIPMPPEVARRHNL